jgi:16S rRNA (guanine966-N2)-methyltransferase
MTRIVGGAAKGRRLGVPDRGTRPTSERAREALFNTLAGMLDLDGTRVLDLFAGSGAVGLEALSRGAAEVEFVESDRRACELIQRNIAAVGLSGATLHRIQAATFLVATGADAPFDFVFADPPYALADSAVTALLESLCTPKWLADDAIVVVERSARGAAPVWPDGIDVIKDKRYGEGVLWYGRRR